MYACWERTGNPKIRIGRIAQDGTIETSEAMSSLWRNRTVTSNPVCKQCRYALYCGGGCAVLAEGRTGRLDRNYCDGFGFRLRAMVAEAYTDHAAGKQAGRSVAPLCDN
ncbi:SPASM domain-containing protein [Catenulispora sp. GAS73]|uniref:SPASM domain-containing protein n=1 Tax=Catenulispora sp. GAS73 TaxID=3156269 RepID=UPI00351139E8